MIDKQTFRLLNAQQGHQVLASAWLNAKAALMAGHRLVLELRPEKRSSDQNAHFHALCSDIARAGVPWAGKKRNATEWKVLIVSGHATATKQGADMVPGLEGEFVNLRESTASMSKARAASLIEYTLAFCAMHDVVPLAGKQWEGYQ